MPTIPTTYILPAAPVPGPGRIPAPPPLPVWSVPIRDRDGFGLCEMPGASADEARRLVTEKLAGTGCFVTPGGRIRPAILHPEHPAHAATEAVRPAPAPRRAA